MMKTTIPFTKDILFKSKIAEITSISLEHELNINEKEVSGNFIVSGDYKTHEVCVNKEDFSYELPFSVEVTENIDLDTLNFEIVDFYYDIIGEDTLRVNIEFTITAQEKKEEEKEEVEVIEENENREEIAHFEEVDEEINNTTLEEIKLSVEEVEEEKEIKEEKEEEEERLDENEKNAVLKAISSNDKEEDEYMTYNVHIVREMETLESISQSYNTTIEIIKEYNNIDTINIGDKIIIPEEKDE